MPPSTVGNWTYRSSDDPRLKARAQRLATAFDVHAEQKPRERLLLYAMVFAMAPDRCLEIGVRFGGGSRIIHAALSDLGHGTLVSVDPFPEPDFDWETIADRATLIRGSSPGDLPRAMEIAGGLFDFVFVDGDHTEKSCAADLGGVLGVAATGACVLCHDAYHEPVARAIDDAVASGGYRDCGMIGTTLNDGLFVEPNKKVRYGGVRMLRKA